MRYLGIDHGEKSIGLALGDLSPEAGLSSPVVSPLMTLKEASPERVLSEIATLFFLHQIDQVVVGLPLNEEGEVGFQGKKVQAFAEKLESRLGKKVEFWDETLSSYEAIHKMVLEETSRKARQEKSDQYAAATILQEYLDSLVISDKKK